MFRSVFSIGPNQAPAHRAAGRPPFETARLFALRLLLP
jgi:hypothetical protein